MRQVRCFVLVLTLGSSPALADPVDLGGYSIDLTKVTVAAFATFADEKGIITQAELTGGGFEWGAG